MVEARGISVKALTSVDSLCMIPRASAIRSILMARGPLGWEILDKKWQVITGYKKRWQDKGFVR